MTCRLLHIRSPFFLLVASGIILFANALNGNMIKSTMRGNPALHLMLNTAPSFQVNNRSGGAGMIMNADTLSADSIVALFTKVKEYRVKTMSIYESMLKMERNSKEVPVNQLQVNNALSEITLIKERFDKIMEQVDATEEDQINDSAGFVKYYQQNSILISQLSMIRPAPAAPPVAAPEEKKGLSTLAITGIVVGGVVLLVGIMVLLMKWQKKRSTLKLQKDLKRKIDQEMQKQLFQVKHSQDRLKI